jgi:hypothetical protein
VITNAAAADRFEAQYPSGAPLDAERQKLLLAALATAGRELALGRLPEAELALKPFDALTDAELDFLRGSNAPNMFNACVMRAFILWRNRQADAASGAMQRCVATYPGLKPPPQPEIQSLFEKAQSAMTFAPLTVQGPAGCVVRLFGVAVGRSPLRLPQVATGRTPVQLECTDAPGRRHLVDVKPGSNTIEMPSFDRAVTSRGALQLIYDQQGALLSHARTDAGAIGEALSARVVVLVHDEANPSSYTVTAPAGAANELGQLRYDALSGADRGDLLRIVEGLRTGAHELDETSSVAGAVPTYQNKRPARSAPGVIDSEGRRSLVQPVIGSALGVLGVAGLITSWALYAERQAYRREARPAISDEVAQGFDARGTRMLAIGGTAAAGLVAAEYLVLPRADGVPLAAWLVGTAGGATAALGLAYALGGDACEPMAITVGERTSRACYAPTSDAMFGPILMLSSVPLLNVPLVYLMRGWLGSSAGAVSLTPSGFAVRGNF